MPLRGFCCTPLSTFETFPWTPDKEPEADPRVQAIAQAAKELTEQRDRWLNADSPLNPSSPDLGEAGRGSNSLSSKLCFVQLTV